VLAHPFRNFPFYGGFKGNLKGIMNKVDALEVLNGRSFFWENKTSKNTATRFGFGMIAGSDSHFGFEVGRCRTLVSPDIDIGKAIRKKITMVEGKVGLVGQFGKGLSTLRTIKLISEH